MIKALAVIVCIVGFMYALIWNAYRVDSLDAQRRDCLTMHNKEKCK